MLKKVFIKWCAGVIIMSLGIIIIVVCLLLFNKKIEKSVGNETRPYIDEIRDNAVFVFNNDIIRISDCIEDEAKILHHMTNLTDESIFAEIKSFSKMHSLAEVSIFTANGTVYSSLRDSAMIEAAPFAALELTEENGRVSSPVIVNEMEQTFLEMSVHLKLSDDTTAVLKIRYDIAIFEEMFSENFLKEDCSIGLAASDGTMLARSGKVPMLYATNSNIFELLFSNSITFLQGSPEMVQEDMQNGRSGFACYSNKETIRYISYAPVGLNDWYISTISTDDYLTAKANVISGYAFQLVLQVLSVITFIAAWVFFVRRRDHRLHLSELSNVAYVDSLTGAANKKQFQITAVRLLSENTMQYAFLVLDIDKFKVLNDTLGYECGDNLLKCIANVIQDEISADETFGRCDSDEYYLLLKYPDNDRIEERVQSIMQEIQTRFCTEMHNNYNLVLCVGIYAITDPSESINVIMDKTKHAHQLAKGGSHSKLAFYSEALHNRILAEKVIENKMHAALDKSEFMLYLQPKYRLCDETICGAEALVRWDTGTDTMLFPDQFIPVFEKTGFITRLDMYMLEKSCALIKSWIDAGAEPLPISINFSRLHLQNARFVDDIAHIVSQYNVPPHLIEVELTESTMMHNESMLCEVLSQLHVYGFSLSMDDFGSGYSSLGLLKNLPVDTIKLDRTFFTEYNDLARAKTVISNMLNMARQLGIFTVAEGVETKEHIDLLRELGCDIVQGYYFAKPMQAAELNESYCRRKIN